MKTTTLDKTTIVSRIGWSQVYEVSNRTVRLPFPLILRPILISRGKRQKLVRAKVVKFEINSLS